MTQFADQHYVEQHNSRTTHLFQAEGFLMKGLVAPAERIEGTKAYWMKHGKGSARKKTRGQPAVPMNPDKSRVSADLATWEAFDEVYTYDLSRQNVNEKENTARAGAMALGRGVDQEIIGVLNTAAPTTGSRFVDMTGVDLNPANLMQANVGLKNGAVPWRKGELFGLLPPLQFSQMLMYKQFSSRDYQGEILPFVNMTGYAVFDNVTWIMMPELAEYAISNAANTYDVFIWHRDAMGWANNEDLKTIWDWDNRSGCWTIRMETEGAAVCVLPEGLARIRVKDSGSVPQATI